jgi:hypothetical protein
MTRLWEMGTKIYVTGADVEQKLLILLEHLRLPLVFGGVRVARSLVFGVMFCRSFLLVIVLSILLRFTAFDYPFGILDLRLLITFLVS